MAYMAVRMSRSGDRPFVGRTRELAAAAEILADTDRAGVALIGGESGLGKTRLVEEIIRDAPPSTLVVRGVAVPRATPIPFELIRAALDPLSVAREDSPVAVAPADSEQYRAMADWEILAANRVLTEAEALRSLDDGSTIFVFEDVHWADPESLDVIDRLMVAGPLGASVLITYRTNALHPDHPTSSFLQRAERRSHVVQFRLEPLRREEVGEYLASSGREVNQQTVEHVHGRTGGNPLLLSELVAATAEDADLTGGLPWTLAEMLRPEIERLPAAERSVAEAVAVLGTSVDFDLLTAALAVTEDELIGRLRFLVDRGILSECGPDSFGFRHDMVGEAVADSLFAREHRRIHAAVHDALLAAGSEDVVALVAHATGAGRTKEAADAARDAATQALADGHSHQAVAFAEQALLEHTDDIDLLRVAVIAGWMTAQYRPAQHHLDRWEELVGGDSAAKAEILHYRVRLFWEQYDAEAADRAAEQLAALADTLPAGVPLVQALADVAQHDMLRGRYPRAIAAADRALDVAATVGPAADAAALQARAERASALVGNPDEQTNAIRELLQVADDASAAEHHVIASRALHNISIHHPMIEPRAHIERMRREGLCAGLNSLSNDSYRRSMLVVSEIEGDRDSFASLIETALDELEDQTELQLVAALFALDGGDTAAARTMVEALSPPPGTSASDFRQPTTTWKAGALALIDLVDGNPDPIGRWIGEIDGDAPAYKFAKNTIPQFLSTLLEAGLADALRPITEDERFRNSTEAFHQGIRTEVAGELEAAEGHYRQALESGMRRSAVDDSEIHLARARVARALGNDPRPHLEAAAARLVRWPGRRLDRIQSMLGGRRTIEAPGGLTPREREVALLVSRGLTNGGIADELFISTKTASVHVSNILAKLSMASRTEIAGWVTAGGLEQPGSDPAG